MVKLRHRAVPNFLAIGRTVTDISRFSDYQYGSLCMFLILRVNSSSSVDSATSYEQTNAQRLGKPRFRRIKSSQVKNGSDEMTDQ